MNVDVPFLLPWLAFAVTWLLLAPLAVLIHVFVRGPLARVAAPQRAVLLLALALLPLAVAAIVAVLGFAPDVGGFVVAGHCHADTGCAPHVPAFQASLVQAVWLGVLVTLTTAGVLWRIAARWRRTRAHVDSLLAFAPRASTGEPAIVDADTPFAYCVGILRPRLIVSRGLLDRLTAREAAAVLAHERAHAARFDNLRQWLAALSLSPLSRSLRRPLLDDLKEANDQSCDRVAAESTGLGAISGALAAGVMPAEGRFDALEAATVAVPPTGVLALVVVAYVACTLPALDATHYGIELVLRWLD